MPAIGAAPTDVSTTPAPLRARATAALAVTPWRTAGRSRRRLIPTVVSLVVSALVLAAVIALNLPHTLLRPSRARR